MAWRLVFRSKSRGGVVKIGPLEHELYRQVGPRLAPVPGHEDEIGEVIHHLVDQLDVLRGELQPWPGHAGADEYRDVQLNALGVDGIHLFVVDRDLGERPRREHPLQNGHVMLDAACPVAGPGSRGRGGDRGDVNGSRKTEPPLAVTVRDRLGEWLRDEEFAGAFGVPGTPGRPPSRLALVTVLQRAENLTDRMAAEAVRTRLDWKYLLGLPLEDPGFDDSGCCRNSGPRSRTRNWSRWLLDALLERLASDGPGEGGREAAHRFHARGRGGRGAEPAGTGRGERPGRGRGPDGCAPGLGGRCPARERVDARKTTLAPLWLLGISPSSKKKQDELAVTYAKDGVRAAAGPS